MHRLEENAFHRKAEIKARQDAKHSKTERLQTVVFVQYCLCSFQTQYPDSLKKKWTVATTEKSEERQEDVAL